LNPVSVGLMGAGSVPELRSPVLLRRWTLYWYWSSQPGRLWIPGICGGQQRQLGALTQVTGESIGPIPS
jgi:hypothetical protein